ncbi:LptA/OstA family protein, partial [bacterium]|nr:LptA/OstA family protein [bacterium]
PGKDGVFSSETAHISAREVLLDVVAGELRMMDNITFVHGTRKLNAIKRVSLMLDPDSKNFFGGSAEGNVQFSDTEFSGSAETISWDPIIGFALLNGQANLDNHKDFRVSGNRIQLNTKDRYYVVDGDAILVSGMQAEPDEGTPTILETPKSESQGSLLARFNSEENPENQLPLIINTQRIEVDESEGRSIFQGGVYGEKGTFRFSASDMEILFDPQTRQLISLSAREEVTLTDRDQVLTGGRLHYDATTGNAEIWENPVMWRVNDQIRADRFAYNENDKLLRMLGNVEAIASIPEKEGDEKQENRSGDQQMYLTAGNGTYDELNETIEFQDNVSMDWGIWNIKSSTLRIELDPVTGQIQGANAFGNVELLHESFKATGHSLTYNPETSILLLRGTADKKCRLTQGERGSQGDVIRFFVNENRFVIEKGMSMIMPAEMTGTLK